MNGNFIGINIPRPCPDTGENEEQISFIEPLRKNNRIKVSSAYMFNLGQYLKGEQPSWSPGFRYEFIFPAREDATAFKLKFGGEEVK